MKKRKYGFDVYINSFVTVVINIIAIVWLLEKGVDLGITLPLAGTNISSALMAAYNNFRLQRQVNNAHQRVTAMKGNANHLPAVIP